MGLEPFGEFQEPLVADLAVLDDELGLAVDREHDRLAGRLELEKGTRRCSSLEVGQWVDSRLRSSMEPSAFAR